MAHALPADIAMTDNGDRRTSSQMSASFRICVIGLLAVVTALVAGVACRPAGASASLSPLFDRDDVLHVRLKAPFNELFDHAFDDQTYTVNGTLSGGGPDIPVTISVRGNSSRYLQECTFPKLTLRLSGEGDIPPPFSGGRKLKIGTHCAERADDDLSPQLGRWGNDKGPHREALVYRLLNAMDLRTLRARPARIEYVYTDPHDNRTPDQHRPFARNALFVEDDDDAMRRFGAEGGLKNFADGRTNFTADDALDLAFGEAMICNFDWCLKFAADDPHLCEDDEILYNVLAFRRQEAAFPVMYDFDLAGMVTGGHRWFDSRFDQNFLESRSAVAIEAIGQVQRMRSLFTREELDAARARFIGRKSIAYRVVDRAPADVRGRAIIRSYLDAFFWAIGDEAVFYQSVVMRGGEVAYFDPGGAAAICAEHGPIPIGTPVSPVVSSAGAMIQIHLLDIVGQLAKECPDIRRGPVWVHQAAVGSGFPE
jgi:hypothetical protein